MNLFNLVATLILNSQAYEQGLDKASKHASSFSSKTAVVFKGLGKAVTAVSGLISGLAAGISKLALSTINYGDDIDKTSQKLLLSAEAYQKWAIAAEMAGTDAATLQTGIRQLTKFTQDLADGTGESLLALQELGIGYEDFMNASPDEQLKMVVEAMQGLEDGTKKTELAQQLFGQRAYQELMPLLNQEKGSIDDLFQSYEDLGLIMSDEMVKQSAKLNDMITILTKQFLMLGAGIGTDMYPQIEMFVNGMSSILKGDFDGGLNEISEAIDGLLSRATEALPKVLDVASTVLLKIIDTLVETIAKPEFLDSLLNLIVKVITKIIEIIPRLASNIGKIITTLIDTLLRLDWVSLIKTLLSAIVEFATQVAPNYISDFIAIFLNLIKNFIKNPTKLINMITDLVKSVMKTVIDIVGTIPSEIMGIVKRVPTLIEDLFGKLLSKEGRDKIKQWGIDFGKNLVNGFIEMIEKGLNWVVDKINVFTKGFSKIWTWVPGLGDKGIPSLGYLSIPRLASGGMMSGKGTLYLAGEAGAEIIASGSHGTGVANVKQIQEAMYNALADIAPVLVNGIVGGLNMQDGDSPRPIIVKLGEKEFKSYVVRASNDNLNQKGRQSLNKVTRY